MTITVEIEHLKGNNYCDTPLLDFVSLESYEEKLFFCDWEKSNFAKLFFELHRVSNILFAPQKLMLFLQVKVSLRLSLLKKQGLPTRSYLNVNLLSQQILRIAKTQTVYFVTTAFSNHLRHENIYTINFYQQNSWRNLNIPGIK